MRRGAASPRRRCARPLQPSRITTLLDGTIDPDPADAEWGAQTDPAKQRDLHARQLGAETAAGTARAPAAKRFRSRRSRSWRILCVMQGLIRAPLRPPVPKCRYCVSGWANEGLIKAEVVDRAPATEMVFDLVGREHDALLNWPPRAAPSALFAPRHVSEEMSQR